MPVTETNKQRDSRDSTKSNFIPPDNRIDNFDDLLPTVLTGEISDEDIIGEVADFGTSTESFGSGGGITNGTTKGKAKNKGTTSPAGAPPNVHLDAKARENAIKSPITEDQLIERIKSMPKNMLPDYIRDQTELIVKEYKINTREKVAILFGQLASESLRGVAEYVYYDKNTLQKASSKFSAFKQSDLEDFTYSDENVLQEKIPYGVRIPPWEKNGLFDSYYGSRNGPRMGNLFNRISNAVNNLRGPKPDQVRLSDNINPGFYAGSPDGYAYRGHGAIQITGREQYEKMNDLFGNNGSKKPHPGVDFLKNPEIVSYNWNPSWGKPHEFTILSALMWWDDHASVKNRNVVDRKTVEDVTKAVSNSTTTVDQRFSITDNYYKYLLGGSIQESPIVANGETPPWLRVAIGEIGVKSIKGSQHNPRILEYQKTVNGPQIDDNPNGAWCSAFANWCMIQSGYSGTRSAAARSWEKYGSGTTERIGAIVVFYRGGTSSGKGHVGFLTKWDDKYLWVIGGNQSNSVKESKYPRFGGKLGVIGFRWPGNQIA